MHIRTMIPFLRKRLWATASVVGLGGVMFLLALPTLLGTKWIYQPLVDRLKAEDFELQIDSVRLRWFSPLHFAGLRLQQSDGSSLISIAEVKSNRGLLGYLLGGRRLGRIEIVQPTIDVKLLSDSSNLDRFVKAIEGKSPKSDSTRTKLAVDLQVAVRQLSATVTRTEDSASLVVVPAFDVDLEYLGASGASELRVAPAEVLKQVELTPELMQLGLGHAIPLLAKSAWFDGRLSLKIGALRIPLDDPEKTSGKAELTLHQVRSGPAEPQVISALDLIARLRGKESQHELVFVDGSIVEIEVGDGRVHHQGLKVGLPKIDPRFQLSTSGSVGMVDRQLDLLLGVPIPVEQLARRDQVKQIGVPTLGLPIRGSLDAPRVEWQQLRGESAQLISLMRSQLAGDAPRTAVALQALEGLASGEADQTIAAAVDLVKELRDRRAARQNSTDAEPETAEENQGGDAEPPKRPLRDALRDLLRKK